MKKISVGITGGVAAGKTTVLGEFAARGFDVVSADDISRRIYRLPRVLAAVKKIFGTTERAAVAASAFRNPSLRKKLEAVIHPAVIAGIRRFVAAPRRRFAAVETPLLFEKKLQKLFNVTVAVSAPPGKCISRLARRGVSARLARLIMRAQMPQRRKARLAGYVVKNTGTIGELRTRARKTIADIVKDSHGKETACQGSRRRKR